MARNIEISYSETTAYITLDGTTFTTDAENARNLVKAADVIRSTRLTANWKRDEGDVAEADRLALWETEFMERMGRHGVAGIVSALVEQRTTTA